MDFNAIYKNSHAHDSGYFTPSPDEPVSSVITTDTTATCATKKNLIDRPSHSYIALISMAILSKTDKRILLNEIYDWVLKNFRYYQGRSDKSWRNSIRHNLSLNECFIKVGKAGNGRGFYWTIHPANLDDFKNGDFRRRQARLRAKHNKYSSPSSIVSKQSSPLQTQEATSNFQWAQEVNPQVEANPYDYYQYQNTYENYTTFNNGFMNFQWLQNDTSS